MKEGVTSKIGYLRISLTEQCNLRCKYCFVNDIVDKSSNITEELFCKAVEMLIQIVEIHVFNILEGNLYCEWNSLNLVMKY